MSTPAAAATGALLGAALEYAKQGLPVFPCRPRDKRPATPRGYKDATADVNQIRRWWSENPDYNIGLPTGAVSGFIVLDGDGAQGYRSLLHADVPATPVCRTGSGGIHLLFRHPGFKVKNAVKLSALPGVDVRGDGGYIVVPPSVHPNGTPYRWEIGPDKISAPAAPAHILAMLNGAAETPTNGGPPAADAVPEGRRNAHLASLGGSMRRRGMSKEAIEVTLREENARRCQPPLAEAEVRSIAESIGRYPAQASPPQGAEILVSVDASAVVDAAEEALLSNASTGIYVRGRQLVLVSRDRATRLPWLSRPSGAPAIIPVEEPHLRELLSESAAWFSASGTAILPPVWAVKMLAARPTWRFPPLAMITETPLLRPNGTVLDRRGYDPATGILFEPWDSDFVHVSERPTLQEARAALEILAEPLCDFPFLSDSDRSATFAAMLSILARPAIAGPVPVFAVRAPSPGAGKGLIADAIAIVGTGRPVARMSAPRDDEEARKRVLAIGIEAPPVVLIDNVEGAFGSAVLAAATTSESWTDRLLGVNRMITVPLLTVWMCTGNNLSFRGDLGRRVVPVDIDPKCEHPEDRTGFKYADLRAHLARERPRLVAAALTLLRAHHVAGCPPHGKPPKGSFEGWDGLVRAALVWVSAPDPLETCRRIREEGDVELDALREAISAWQSAFAQEAKTTAEAVARADKELELASALGTLAGCRPGKLDARRLGYALRRVAGRIARGRRFEREGGSHGRSRWCVRSEAG